MNDDDSGHGWLVGLLVVPLMLLCCGGPAIVAIVVSLGVGGWLTAHGAWVVAAVIAAAGVAAATALWRLTHRGRSDSCCAPNDAGPEGSDRRLRDLARRGR
jgi:membrane protein implicated in regulation of membrane protease activity